MKWSGKYKGRLPDNCYAYVDGSIRKLPIFNARGNLDEGHLHSALARLWQADLPDPRMYSEIEHRLIELQERLYAGQDVTNRYWTPVSPERRRTGTRGNPTEPAAGTLTKPAAGSSSTQSFMEDFWAGTHPHPFSNRERLYYFRDNGQDIIVSVELRPFQGQIHLSAIATLPPDLRGRGVASQVLAKLCALADKHGVIIGGTAKPFGSPPGLNKTALLGWYRRAGFTADRYGSITRLPREARTRGNPAKPVPVSAGHAVDAAHSAGYAVDAAGHAAAGYDSVQIHRLFEVIRHKFVQAFPRSQVARAKLIIHSKLHSPGSPKTERDVAWAEPGKMQVNLVRRALGFEVGRLVGILAHELGHLVDTSDAPGAERRADTFAEQATGRTILYDEADLENIHRGSPVRPKRLHQ